jgi:hypothetical protein
MSSCTLALYHRRRSPDQALTDRAQLLGLLQVACQPCGTKRGAWLARLAGRIPVHHPQLERLAGDALEMATVKRALNGVDVVGPGIPAIVGIQMPAGEKSAVGVGPLLCARAANGHAAAAPPRRVMNSRRLNTSRRFRLRNGWSAAIPASSGSTGATSMRKAFAPENSASVITFRESCRCEGSRPKNACPRRSKAFASTKPTRPAVFGPQHGTARGRVTAMGVARNAI